MAETARKGKIVSGMNRGVGPDCILATRHQAVSTEGKCNVANARAGRSWVGVEKPLGLQRQPVCVFQPHCALPKKSGAHADNHRDDHGSAPCIMGPISCWRLLRNVVP